MEGTAGRPAGPMITPGEGYSYWEIYMNDFDLGFDLSKICLLDEAEGEEKASSNLFLEEKFISTFFY